MLRRHMIWLVALKLTLGTAAIAQILSRSESRNARRSDYAPVNGLRTRDIDRPLRYEHMADDVATTTVAELWSPISSAAPRRRGRDSEL